MALALSELVKKKYVDLGLSARTKVDAMRELVELLAMNGEVGEPEKFLEEVVARENTSSTLADRGVAFPHARTELVDHIVLAIGRSQDGIPWNENGERAHLIFLIGVPQKMLNDYLVVIGTIARTTKDNALRTLLLHAENIDEFIETMLAAPSL